MSSKKDDVGARLEQAMAVRGMGRNEIDRALGYSEGYTSRTISAGRRPRADTLRRMAEVLHISTLWLVEGVGPMDRTEAYPTTKPRLTVALAYHDGRWNASTIAAAQALEIEGEEILAATKRRR